MQNIILYLIIIANIVVYYLTYTEKLSLGRLADSYSTTLRHKQYYRLITSAFCHKNIIHLVLNMIALYNVGTSIIFYYGPILFVIIYFVTMIAGEILSLLIHHNQGQDDLYSVGSSGAICGLIGAILMLYAYHFGILNAFRSLSTTLIYLVVMSFLPQVDGVSHICCLAVGVAVAYLLMLI